MILNNLDADVAQFPHELVTYGGNGQVFSNWLQFRLVMRYLVEMNDKQTLIMYSGHPLGLFPSNRHSPRLVITNGMVFFNKCVNKKIKSLKENWKIKGSLSKKNCFNIFWQFLNKQKI